jgi:hypothetical protein
MSRYTHHGACAVAAEIDDKIEASAWLYESETPAHRHERESTATNTLRSTVHVRPGRTELATELPCRTAAQRSHAMRSSVAESWRKGLGPGVPSPICN